VSEVGRKAGVRHSGTMTGRMRVMNRYPRRGVYYEMEYEMNKSDLDALRRQLLELSSRVRSDAATLVEQTHTPSGGNGGSELSNAPFHIGDMGTEEYLYDMNATLLANEQYIVGEAREALRRIDEDTFGKCQACGRPISKARLEAIPYTRFCVKCAAANDATPQVNLNEGRPQSPDDTLAPEGEMDEDRLKHRDPLEFPRTPVHRGDVHAAGSAGGGTAVGGLAGSNEGNGDPKLFEVDEATASGHFDAEDDRANSNIPMSGRSGGAVGGTPVFKRAK
jgi:RNA polymerase-binding transcription factor DksA